jgi:hypothetical protein
VAAVWNSGAAPVVVLNKVYLEADHDNMHESIDRPAVSVPVVRTSASTGAGVMAAVDDAALTGGFPVTGVLQCRGLVPLVVGAAPTRIYVSVPSSKSQAVDAPATALAN